MARVERVGAVRNPGDDELRALERAALHDPAAANALGRALNRTGRCARCRRTLPLVARANEEAPLECGVCAAQAELHALMVSTTTYMGYVGRMLNDPPGPRGAGGQVRFITTFHGFPLAIVTMEDDFESHRAGGVFVTFTWRAYDRWTREWYGRASGYGLLAQGVATGMRLRRTTPGVAPSRRRRIDVPGDVFESTHPGRASVRIRELHARQTAWLVAAEHGYENNDLQQIATPAFVAWAAQFSGCPPIAPGQPWNDPAKWQGFEAYTGKFIRAQEAYEAFLSGDVDRAAEHMRSALGATAWCRRCGHDDDQHGEVPGGPELTYRLECRYCRCPMFERGDS